MEMPTYKVILLGACAGVAEAQAQAGFAKLFGMSADKAEQIFSRPGRVLKTGLGAEQAKKYRDRLAEVGVACELVRETAGEAAGPKTDAPQPRAPDEPPRPAFSEGESPADSDEPRQEPFVFTGKGFEYFKIWIVNILLSVVTLGIYSAWAKVRNKQYFYGNTYLDDSSFEYTADPVKILIGRVIALVFLILYSLSGQISIVLGMVMALALMVALPWVICKSLRFNARYSRYRNVRFAFNGRLSEAALVFILWPILGLLTFGILMPYALFLQKQFIYRNHAYGTREFEFSATAKQYYLAALVALAIYIGAAVLFLIPFVGPLLVFVAYLYGFAYITTALANINYNAISLGQHALSANWNSVQYLLLVLVNTLLIVLTLGLFIPWAKVRTARFKAEHTQAVFVGNFDIMAAQEEEAVDALGESVGDLFDIEIGF